ncbi:IS3 family transposase [Paraburkholderia hospita]|uniref:IS3 family transposase n=1 Tax=Paraburkholderia hospita TaxID=169430 RepID=A0AAN1JKQ1_9BURK|nr:IS3 family transposase [Paraburkholderia hospita]AUT75540.1 IS3 family transposase [Paraburkholderia hospita]
MEVLTGPERRRRWSAEEKLTMVRESFEPGKSVSMVARQHGVNPNQLFHWRKLYQDGSLSAVSSGEEVVPASELNDALKQIRELQRLLGKKTMENEILREAVEVAKSPKMDCALTLIARGRPVKRVCEVLGVARSNVADKLARPADWRDGRTARSTNDAGLVEEIRLAVADLPSYGYRRVWGLLRRQREKHGAAPVNAKRVYRVMRVHGLLIERRTAPPRPQRRHDGKVAVAKSNQRWCSDGFEFRCDNGEPLRVTFALDCCDREAMSWAATTGGHSGDVVRDVMLAAVENRFGDALKAPSEIEWLTDNGSGYTAEKTRTFASDIGLKPLTTPVCSPQSNGMAESFVKTMKRDYVAFMPKPDAATAARNLAVAFEHYNEQHPHSALKYRSPREFRRRTDSSTQV